jgi:hypothetical protein
MKQIYILITSFLTLFYSNSSFTQVTEVVTGLNRPIKLALNGNDLYIAESDGNKISKTDITAKNTMELTLLQGWNVLMGLFLIEIICISRKLFWVKFQK